MGSKGTRFRGEQKIPAIYKQWRTAKIMQLVCRTLIFQLCNEDYPEFMLAKLLLKDFPYN